MLSRPMMVQPKFSIELPKLRIRPTRSDRALREHLTSPVESPPQTPKSVRPPLPIEVETGLRIACASVVNDYKYSSRRNTQHGNKKPHLTNPPSRNEADVGSWSQDFHVLPPSLVAGSRPLIEQTVEEQARAMASEGESARQTPERLPGQGYPRDDFERKAKLNDAVARVDQLMAGSAQSRHGGTMNRELSHSRSRSTPHARCPPPALKIETNTRPSVAPRTASIDTNDSAAHTDTTDDRMTASTAFTSAAMTPAWSSKRTSSHALQFGFEIENMPKSGSGNIVSMRQELDRHRILQEQQTVAAAAAITAIINARPKAVCARPVVQTPEPHPLPQCATFDFDRSLVTRRFPLISSAQLDDHQQCEDRSRSPGANVANRRAKSKSVSSARIVEVQYQQAIPVLERREDREADSEGRQGRQSLRSRAASSARSLSRGIKEYIRPSSRHDQSSELNKAYPESQVRGTLSHAEQHSRPGTATSQGKQSINFSRGPCHVSKHSTTSIGSESFDARSLRGREKHVFNLIHAHASDIDLSRPQANSSNKSPPTRLTKRRSRSIDAPGGRRPTTEHDHAMPPLPSLDIWRARQSSVGAIADESPSISPVWAKDHDTSFESSRVSPLPFEEQANTTRDYVGVALASSVVNLFPPGSSPPESPSAKRFHHTDISPALSRKTSFLPIMSATIQPGDFDIHGYVRTPSPISVSSLAGMTPRARIPIASRATEVSHSPVSPTDEIVAPQVATIVSKRSNPAMKPQLVNFSRKSTTSVNLNLTKVDSTISLPPPPGPPVQAIARDVSLKSSPYTSRNQSVASFRRPSNLSVEYHTEMDERRYQNTVKILHAANSAASKDRSKKKWWKPSAKEKKIHWMDAVLQSGSNGGVMLMDESAAAPIVRY